MHSISILIKPASSLCNLNCSYCFYEDVSDNRETKSYGYMSTEVAKEIIDNTLNSKDFQEVTFAFQGGEPMLIGLDFYKWFSEYCKKNQGNKSLNFVIQTNGVLINDDWAVFFKENGFLVGISIDGFKENHDFARHKRGAGTFDEVFAGVNLLKKHKIDFNVLTVLTKQLSEHATELYEFYRESNFEHIQIVECLPSFGTSVDKDSFACTPQTYELFYKDLFSAWFEELVLGKYRSIGIFDDIIRVFGNQRPSQCGRLGFCSMQNVIEADGSVYPCDFYVLDDYNLGNIKEKPFKDILHSKTIEEFKNINQELPKICFECKYKRVCNGGCKRLRESYLKSDYCAHQELLDLFSSNYEEILYSLDRIKESQ